MFGILYILHSCAWYILGEITFTYFNIFDHIILVTFYLSCFCTMYTIIILALRFLDKYALCLTAFLFLVIYFIALVISLISWAANYLNPFLFLIFYRIPWHLMYCILIGCPLTTDNFTSGLFDLFASTNFVWMLAHILYLF
jgi:hypothetical protein